VKVVSPSASVFILARGSVNQFPLVQGRAATWDGKLAELGVHQFDYNQVVIDRKLAVARFFQAYPGKGRRRDVLYPVKDAFERSSAKIVGSIKRWHIGRRSSGERIESGAIFFDIDTSTRVRVIDITPTSLAMKCKQQQARVDRTVLVRRPTHKSGLHPRSSTKSMRRPREPVAPHRSIRESDPQSPLVRFTSQERGPARLFGPPCRCSSMRLPGRKRPLSATGITQLPWVFQPLKHNSLVYSRRHLLVSERRYLLADVQHDMLVLAQRNKLVKLRGVEGHNVQTE
jgi:hypothetical protein